MTAGAFLDQLRALLDGIASVGIVWHRHADPDAFGSALAMRELVQFLQPALAEQVTIYGTYRALVETIIRNLGLDTSGIAAEMPVPPDLVILVDVHSLEFTEFPELAATTVPVAVVDHHPSGSPLAPNVVASFIDETAHACAELVFDLVEAAGCPLSRVANLVLLAGILTDTSNFVRSSKGTMIRASQIIERGVEMEEAHTLLRKTISRSERIARLKGATRMMVHKLGDWVVAVSHTSSFQASVCNALIELGADAAFVIAQEKKNRFKVSGRATRRIIAAAPLHLGHLMESLGEQFGGEGGGHDGAAGASGEYRTEDFFSEINQSIVRLLRGALHE